MFRDALTRIGLVTLLAVCIAGAGAPLSMAAGNDPNDRIRAEGPGAVFDSIQAAALDALTDAHLTATPRDRQRLRVGTIHRVDNGYSYTAPRRAGTSTPLMRQSVRYRLRSIDVASYVIQPSSGEARSNRSNEMPSEEEKRIVDELDPAHRPLYLLTPSLDAVSYRRGGQLRVITNLNDRRLAKCTEAVIATRNTGTLAFEAN